MNKFSIYKTQQQKFYFKLNLLISVAAKLYITNATKGKVLNYFNKIKCNFKSSFEYRNKINNKTLESL